MVLAVCFHLHTMKFNNIVVREPNEATAGVPPLQIMTRTSNGDSAPIAFYLMVAVQMETVAIFRSYMAGKCTRLAPLRMKPGPGAPQHTTLTSINNGVIVEVT